MPFDPRPFVAHHRAEAEAERKAIQERAALALEEAHRIAKSIESGDPAVRRVILFGSLAEAGPRRLDFDIDLCLDGGDLYRAMDAADDSPFEVDIVRLDLLPQHVREHIQTRGRPLAGR